MGEAGPRERDAASAAAAGQVFDGDLGVGAEQAGDELDEAAADAQPSDVEEGVELGAVGGA